MTFDPSDILRLPVDEAAPGLLGMRLRSDLGGVITEVEITEVEAYGGPDDPASHAHRGLTTRNASMFREAGTLYVYRSYGVHWCANVVTGGAGSGEAILIRGGRPTRGLVAMERRRGRTDHLTDGPGKLCRALGIDGTLDGSSVFDGPVCLRPAPEPPVGTIIATPRVGISRATERLWRFTLIA